MSNSSGPEAVAPSFEGRVALVTGASGGIGQALAMALAREGAAVALAYGSRGEVTDGLAEQIIRAGGQAVSIGADLTSTDGPTNLIEEVDARLGPVDLLMSNAGRGQMRSLEDLTVTELDQTIAINLRAPLLLAQQTVPGMAARGYGRVVFVSSVAAFIGGMVGPHYAASKAGLHGLTHSLASRYASSGVTVNALAPALIAETGMLPGEPDELMKKVPVRRLGQPTEVADLALAIVRNPYVTNQVVSVDGGIHPR